MNIADASEYSDQLRELRQDLDGMIAVGLAKCKAGNGRYMSLTRTHLQAARAWMGKTLGALPGNPNPYQAGQAGGLQRHNTFVPATADVNQQDEALLESQLFLDSETLGVQRVKRLRTHLIHVCSHVHGLRQNLDPLAFGENGLSPFECLSTLLVHLHQASIWLGYELSDMADDKRGGATTEQEPKKDKASTTTGSSATPSPEPTTEAPSSTESSTETSLTEPEEKESPVLLSATTAASTDVPAISLDSTPLADEPSLVVPNPELTDSLSAPDLTDDSTTTESLPLETSTSSFDSLLAENPEPEPPKAVKSRKRK